MPRSYRAVMISGGERLGSGTVISATSDFDAFLKAKEALGPETHFDLWEGERRALTHRPNPNLRAASRCPP